MQNKKVILANLLVILSILACQKTWVAGKDSPRLRRFILVCETFGLRQSLKDWVYHSSKKAKSLMQF